MKSRKVSVKAVNLKDGDVVDGERISQVILFRRRSRAKRQHAFDRLGVAIITPHPDGYDINVRKFVGSDRVTIKRPEYNR